jgi:four helix bundle suffix protein
MNQNNQNNQNSPSGQNSQGSQSTQNNQSNQSSQTTPSTQKAPTTFLPQHGHYRHLRVYQVTEIIYDITYYFTQHYLGRGDRTIDQMVQAARSGKQNIAEGNQAAATSSETEIKLTNVAKASLEELLDDYEDYLRVRNLQQWGNLHPRYEKMRLYARSEDFQRTYAAKIQQMTDEEIANLCITLVHQAITLLHKLLLSMQQRFVAEGGIKERMHQARTGYRQQQDKRLAELEQAVPALQQQLVKTQEEAAHWKAAYEDLKQRALKAYTQQQQEIESLKKSKEEEA